MKLSHFLAKLAPLKRKIAVISSKFRHLIWQNNENLHDNSKFGSVRSHNGIVSKCIGHNTLQKGLK